jgi:hypothetical protein
MAKHTRRRQDKAKEKTPQEKTHNIPYDKRRQEKREDNAQNTKA